MTLTREEKIFLFVLLINLIIAVVYLLWYTVLIVSAKSQRNKQKVRKERKETEEKGEVYEEQETFFENRRTYLLRFFVMLFCPVIGPLFYLISYLLYITIFRSNADLADVIFSKERVRTQVKADEERERNIVPLEEAIVVNEKKNLREYMMNMLMGNIKNSLSSIAMALNTEDSESSHYAASVLSDELNDFRANVHKLYAEMQEEPDDQTACELTLIDYMENVLRQKVFTDLEQKRYVQMMEEIAEKLYGKKEDGLSAHQFETVCLRLLEIEEFDKSEKWCLRLAQHYPDQLCSYTCRLKLYFTAKRREEFFHTLESLKSSDVVIDNETLELIRIFS